MSAPDEGVEQNPVMNHRLSKVVRRRSASQLLLNNFMPHPIVLHGISVPLGDVGKAVTDSADWVATSGDHLLHKPIGIRHCSDRIVYKPCLDKTPRVDIAHLLVDREEPRLSTSRRPL